MEESLWSALNVRGCVWPAGFLSVTGEFIVPCCYETCDAGHRGIMGEGEGVFYDFECEAKNGEARINIMKI